MYEKMKRRGQTASKLFLVKKTPRPMSNKNLFPSFSYEVKLKNKFKKIKIIVKFILSRAK